MSNSLRSRGLQHARLPFPSQTPGAFSNSYPSSQYAIQPSHPLSPTSPPIFNLSQHQGFFQGYRSSHQVDKALEFQLQHKSFQWIFKTLEFTSLIWSPRDSQEFSPTPQFKSIDSSVLNFLYGPTLTFIHDYWKNHSFDWTDLCRQSNVSAF